MDKGEIPDSFRIPLRALLWEYGIHKTVKQDEIIAEMFFNGYRKLPKYKPPLVHADGCTTNLGIIGAICNCGAEAQRELDIKHYEAEI